MSPGREAMRAINRPCWNCSTSWAATSAVFTFVKLLLSRGRFLAVNGLILLLGQLGVLLSAECSGVV